MSFCVLYLSQNLYSQTVTQKINEVDWKNANWTDVDEIKLNHAYTVLHSYLIYAYYGEWSIGEQDNHKIIHSSFKNNKGIASLRGYTNIDIYTGRRIFNTALELYDGEYRDQVENINIKFEIEEYVFDDNSIHIKSTGTLAKKYFVNMFTKFEDENCFANITFDFSHKFGNINEAKIEFDSITKEWLPSKLTIVTQYPHDKEANPKRILNYTFIVFCTLCFFCYAMIRQIRKAEQNEKVAKQMSVITICGNIVWNFTMFNFNFKVSMLPMSTEMMAPAFFYFMICFLFELKLLRIWWEGNNISLIRRNTIQARKSMVYFYIKFYCVCLLFIYFSDLIFSNLFLLIIFNGLIWVPQIIKNAYNKSRNVPDIKFIISMTLTQCFLPAYMRGWPKNLFLVKPNIFWSSCFIEIILTQIFILILQRKFGARFFLPKNLRNWKQYDYLKSVTEFDEVDDTECWICLESLSCTNTGRDQIENQTNQYQRIEYMLTPCGHKFHIDWLTPWMNQKLECPKWRAELPAIEDDEEYYYFMLK